MTFIQVQKSRTTRLMAVFMVFSIVVEIISPLSVYAITSGPSQPEVQSFEPIGTNQMVDVFSGDFTYNIPLLDVGGYPVNISYHAGIGMEQDASWVGLGWNINPGVVNRNMRGIPDDFNGTEKIKKTTHIKPNWNLLLKTNIGNKYKETFGFKNPEDPTKKNDYSVGIYYNNYKGLGFDFNYQRAFKGIALNTGYNTGSGIDVSATTGLGGFGNLSMGYNSSHGVQYAAASFRNKFKGTSEKEMARGSATKTSYVSSSHSLTGIAYMNPSYMPTSNPNMFASSYDLNLKFGKVKSKGRFVATQVDANLTVLGIRKDKEVDERKAYGYFHIENADDDGLMDFNRDNEITPNKQLDHLPTTILTHDIYSVSGQGTGGVFRPYRSRVGLVGDPNFNLVANAPNFGLGPELGVNSTGDSYHIGLDLTTTLRFAASKKWDVGIFNNYSYGNPNPSVEGEYENWYFKSAGEKTVIEKSFYDDMGQSSAVYVKLDGANLKNTKNELGCLSCTEPVSPQTTALTKRAVRNQPIFTLTGAEAKYCLDREIINYYTNANGQYAAESLTSSYRKTNHIREVSSISADGSRYVYGLPAYNTSQKEVTFAIHSTSNMNERKESYACANQSIVKYTPGSDNSTSNDKGRDNLYTSTETPAYAHSYLLTAVLSSDYVDLDNNGPSTSDLGNYTKFNYTRAAESYGWRTPFTGAANQARLLEGNKSDLTDDRAYYTYGEKELWYMYTIETKTHIAEFILNDPSANPRKDGYDVNGENGERGTTSKLRYLEKIVLYSREDKEKNGASAVPIKTIHFEYDYSLCGEVPSNDGASLIIDGVNINTKAGKLTLKKIWFTYGNTTQGSLSPYVFIYSSENPNYNSKAIDRWGNYKEVNCNDNLNDDFPYVKQDKTKADLNASVWNLSQIKLPSGGKIEVHYEADDYGFVQDKQAMEMIDVIGLGTTSQFVNANNLLYERGFQKKTNKYIFFNLPPGVNVSNVEEKLNPEEEGIYFKFLVDLNGKNKYDYVSGYLNKETIGVDNSKGYDVGFIKIENVDVSRTNPIDAHPISKAAWHKTRVELPHLVHKETDDFQGYTDLPTTRVAKKLFAVIPRLGKVLIGVNMFMLSKLYGQKVSLNGHSVIRLKTPNKTKFGGGHRVKKILMYDEWNTIASSDETQITGQVYDYSKKDNLAPNSTQQAEVISSGVATYEPLLGGEANPHKYPIQEYGVNRIAAINDVFQLEGPVGESYYPSPSVGYSQITIRNIKPTDIGLTESITRHGTGKTVYEFYTAYDFPVYSERYFYKYDMSEGDFGTTEIATLLGFKIDYKSVTQGFSIVLNDMHGKPKAKYDYGELDDETPISFIKYKYQVADENLIHKRLDNTVTVLNKDGSISNNKLIGVETELVFDTKSDEEYGGRLGLAPNLNLIGTPSGPIPVPTFFFSYSNFYISQFRRVTATKLVNMYGVLDRVEVKEDGAVITTKNVAYDAETGEVLLTHTQNEYTDDIYNFSYPAHWAYEGMGPAYKNTGMVFSANNTSTGYATVASGVYDVLTVGDELGKINGGTELKAWVLKKLPSNQILLIDVTGNPIADDNYQFKVLRSGKRNLQNIPVGSIVSNKNPINTSTNTFANPTEFGSDVLNASATQFSDDWQHYTDKILFGKGVGKNNSTGASVAKAYAGFLHNLIFSGKLLTTPGVKIEDYLNSPKANSSHELEQGQLAYIYGLAGSPYNHVPPPTSITPLTWNILNNSSSLTAKINCSGGGGCGNSCEFNIKLYEPLSGFNFASSNASDYIFSSPQSKDYLVYNNPFIYKQLDISTDLTNLSFDENSNFLNTHFDVYFDYTTQKYKYVIKLNATNGKIYHFLIETGCVYSVQQSSCSYEKTGTSTSLVPDNLYNPFIWNVKGSWAPKKSLVYYDIRDGQFARKSGISTITTSTSFNNTNTRVDGKLKEFIPYWYKQGGEEYWTPEYQDNGYTPWTWNSELTIKNPYGLELESKDALGIYSAAIYGNNNTLPIAVASNAKLNEFCYEGFEEPYENEVNFNPKHFKFLPDIYNGLGSFLAIPTPDKRVKHTDKEAHSGKYSIEILKKESGDASHLLALNQSLSVLTSINDLQWQWPDPDATSTNNTDPNFSKVQESNVIKNFSPEPGKEYIISYWVKFDDEPTSGTLNCDLRYYDPNSFYNSIYDDMYDRALDPNCTDVSSFNTTYSAYYHEINTAITPGYPNTYLSMSTSQLGNDITINGWKRVQLKFTIPVNAPNLKINFVNTSDVSAFIDDVRIFPVNANMKSYAFDNETRRLMAELDENNYATFYEYDDQGNMVRVKRETDNGIMTINENRKNIRKQ